MVVVRKAVRLLSSKAEIRMCGIRYRRYETRDNFVNVAPWAAADFKECGNEPVDYFASQEPFIFVDQKREVAFAIHGDHVHVLPRSRITWRLESIGDAEARELLNRFIGWLRGKGVNLEDP